MMFEDGSICICQHDNYFIAIGFVPMRVLN